MLSTDQIHAWRHQGAFVMQLPDAVIQPSLDWLNSHFTLKQVDPAHLDFGSADKKFEFPTNVEALDNLVLNEQLITAVQQLLQTPDIRLLQADLWPKVGVATDDHDAQSNTDQRIHMDYGNNTLLHPDWHQPEAVAAIIYYDDSDVTSGGTAFVPRQGDTDPVYQPPFIHMPGQAGKPFFNDRRSVEQWFKENDPHAYALRSTLYEREVRVDFKPGTILFYRHDIWHRGTPLTPHKLRRVHNLGWRRADARGWTNWNEGWARQSYYGNVESIIGRSTPLQRSLLDFPLPGDSYWTTQRIANVEARFGFYGFDGQPYRAALMNG
jgi:ectoine hydroxylase-related dioxygenase (phytanoyl-CoA dioxygenase family)